MEWQTWRGQATTGGSSFVMECPGRRGEDGHGLSRIGEADMAQRGPVGSELDWHVLAEKDWIDGERRDAETQGRIGKAGDGSEWHGVAC